MRGLLPVAVFFLLALFLLPETELFSASREQTIREANLALCNIFHIRFQYQLKAGEWADAEHTAWQMHLFAERIGPWKIRKNCSAVCRAFFSSAALEAGDALSRWSEKMDRTGNAFCASEAHLFSGLHLLRRNPEKREQAQKEAEFFLSRKDALRFSDMAAFAGRAAEHFPERAEFYAETLRAAAGNAFDTFRAERILFRTLVLRGKREDAIRLADDRIRMVRDIRIREKWLKLRLAETERDRRKEVVQEFIRESGESTWSGILKKYENAEL